MMGTIKFALGVAKLLLNSPTTDVNITNRSGEIFLFWVRQTIKDFSNIIAIPVNPKKIQHEFLLRQWREIEEVLAEGGPLIPVWQRLCHCLAIVVSKLVESVVITTILAQLSHFRAIVDLNT
jgi:hypothetical protein